MSLYVSTECISYVKNVITRCVSGLKGKSASITQSVMYMLSVLFCFLLSQLLSVINCFYMFVLKTNVDKKVFKYIKNYMLHE